MKLSKVEAVYTLADHLSGDQSLLASKAAAAIESLSEQLDRAEAERDAAVAETLEKAAQAIRDLKPAQYGYFVCLIIDECEAAIRALKPDAGGTRGAACLHACEGLDTADLSGNERGWLAEVVHGAARVEHSLDEALRARCAGNTDDDEPVNCQAYEASEQTEPCPPGCCVMAEGEDVRNILAAIEREEEPQSTADAGGRVPQLSGLLKECLELSDNWPGIAYAYDLEARIKSALAAAEAPVGTSGTGVEK